MRVAVLVLVVLTLGSTSGQSHQLLDPDRVQALLGDVARHHHASRGDGDTARLDSLFHLGEAIEGIVASLNHDLAHGSGSLMAQLIVKRLQAYGIGVAVSPRTRRYVYDGIAFREYVKGAPAGRWAPDARFRLIAARFGEMPPPDAEPALHGDAAALIEAVGEEERFLRDYPRHDRAPLVRFYLAVDCYRVMRTAPDEATVRRFEQRARRELEIAARTPAGDAEARATQVLLERLREARASPTAR